MKHIELRKLHMINSYNMMTGTYYYVQKQCVCFDDTFFLYYYWKIHRVNF